MSTRLARFETAIVAVIVLGITVSALVTVPVGGDAELLVLCVSDAGERDGAVALQQRLVKLLASDGTRRVVVELCRSDWPDECDVVVMSVHDFRRAGRSAGFKAVASIDQSAGAVMIARADDIFSPAELDPGDVLFASPRAINGCWLQLQSFARFGKTPSAGLAGLRFAEAPGAAAVVRDVVAGRSRAGAVPREIVDKLMADGSVAPTALRFVAVIASLPETLLCCRPDEVARVASILDDDPGLDPFTVSESSRLDGLFDWVGSLAGGSQ